MQLGNVVLAPLNLPLLPLHCLLEANAAARDFMETLFDPPSEVPVFIATLAEVEDLLSEASARPLRHSKTPKYSKAPQSLGPEHARGLRVFLAATLSSCVPPATGTRTTTRFTFLLPPLLLPLFCRPLLACFQALKAVGSG